MIRILIADDERLARDGLRALLEEQDGIQIVGEARDGPEAAEQILALQPDLVLLDVQMPGCDGFEVIRRVSGAFLPMVVFVSAYDQFALRAFEVHALDYVLKPPSAERLSESMRRARMELARDLTGGRGALAGLLDALDTERASGLSPRRLVVKDRNRYLLLAESEVAWVQAARNYVEIYARGQCFLLRASMQEIVQRLDPSRFKRVHRSIIVNLDRVKEVRAEESGDFHVALDTGEVVRMSRRYREQLLPRT